MNAFTIKDLENLSGIKAHTIRIWEQRYSFLRPQRTTTNIRYYTNEELKTVLNIALLNKYGYKISHIDKMTVQEVREKLMSLLPVEAQQERLVNDLLQFMIDLDLEGFEELLDTFIRAKGIDKAVSFLILPFLERIGILWTESHLHPIQEHVVVSIIRQKLVVGIESVISQVTLDKKVVLFLPEGEFHELGLLYTYYLLRSRGVQVIYLGSNVPYTDLEFIVKVKQPHYLYTHLTCVGGQFNVDRFVQKMKQHTPNVPLIVSGQCMSKKLPPGVQFKSSLSDVLEFTATLQKPLS